MQNKWLAAGMGTAIYQPELQMQTVPLTSPGQMLEKQGMAFEQPSHLHEKRNQKFSSHPLCCCVTLSLIRLLFTLVISNTLSFLIRYLHICFTCKYSDGNFFFL